MTIEEQTSIMYKEINEGWNTKDIHEICRKHLTTRARAAAIEAREAEEKNSNVCRTSLVRELLAVLSKYA